MPEMNGDQLVSAIKQVAPGKPVIMLTGFGDLMGATGEMPLGVDRVIGKPVALTTLREAVAQVIQDHPAASE